jgi:hypothetical protein
LKRGTTAATMNRAGTITEAFKAVQDKANWKELMLIGMKTEFS